MLLWVAATLAHAAPPTDDVLRLARLAPGETVMARAAWVATLRSFDSGATEVRYEAARLFARGLPRDDAAPPLRRVGALCLSAVRFIRADGERLTWPFGATRGLVLPPEGATALECPVRVARATRALIRRRGGEAWRVDLPAGESWVRVPLAAGGADAQGNTVGVELRAETDLADCTVGPAPGSGPQAHSAAAAAPSGPSRSCRGRSQPLAVDLVPSGANTAPVVEGKLARAPALVERWEAEAPSPARERVRRFFGRPPEDELDLDAAQGDLGALLDLAALGPEERATRALELALALDPAEASVGVALARLERDRGHAFAGLQRLDELTAARSSLLGDAPVTPGRPDGSEAPPLTADDVTVSLARAELLADAGALAEAQRLLEALPAELPVVLDTLASTLQRRGLPERAFEAWNRRQALGHSEEALGAALELAKSLGRPAEALARAEQLVAGRPDHPGYRLEQIRLLRLVRDTKNAEARMAQAERLFPDDADVSALAGQLHAAAGREALSRAAYQRSLRLRPLQPELRAELAALDGERAVFAAPWRLDPAEVSARSTKGQSGIVSSRRVTRLHADGASDSWSQLLFRVGDEPRTGEEGAERVFTFDYDPSRRSQDVLDAAIYREGVALADATLDDVALGEAGAALYVEVRSTRISFTGAKPGDILAVEVLGTDFAKNELLGMFSEVAGFGWTEAAEDAEVVWLAPEGIPLVSALSQGPGRAQLVESRQLWRSPEGGLGTLLSVRATHIPKLVVEPHMPGYTEVAAYAHVSSLPDWAAVASWFNRLGGDALERTPGSDALSRSLVEPGTALPEALQTLFDYVARRVRYVGLEFGVHGYKPYGVTATLRRAYGDCKDKAVLLRALLAAAGHRADLVLVRTRGKGTLRDAVASPAAFDHAIVYVPELDRFVDPTANWNGALELPQADQGATALILASEGARKAVIPSRPPAENHLALTVTLEPTTEGYALSGQLTATGNRAADLRQTMTTEATRLEVFQELLATELPGALLETVEAELDFASTASVRFSATLPAGAVPVLPPTWSMRRRLAPLPARTFDVVLEPFSWSRELRFPEGAFVLPPDQSVEVPGVGRASRKGRPGALKLEVVVGTDRVSAKGYPSLRQLADDADRLFEPVGRLEPRP